jgi:TolB protein
MKKFVYSILLCTISLYGVQPQQSTHVTFNLEKQNQEKMKLLIGLINPHEHLTQITTVLKEDLTCAQQTLNGFNVTIQTFEKAPSKRALKKLAQEGFALVVFLQEVHNNNALEWRIYDSLQATMQKGKRMTITSDFETDAHRVADALWLMLTGQEGIFSTRIAYCAQRVKNNHMSSDIYIKAPYSNKAHCLVKGGKLLAPRWNKDRDNSLLLYSEVTPSNIRLMSINRRGKRRIVSNFDGVTMLPSFSADGQKVVCCASYKGTSQIYCTSYDLQKKQKITQRITHNSGNNTSPLMLSNGDIIFCSDFETKTPQIYQWHSRDDTLERITQSGYCACPHFSEKKQKMVYCKLIDSTMQLFLYDVPTKQHKQLTFSKGNKDECCWSPCGNYVAYSLEEGSSSRIAIFNIMSQEQSFLTSDNERCSYPSWSLPIKV